MYIFNTTFSVNSTRVDEWKEWTSNVFLPGIGSMMITNGIEVFEVLNINDDDSRTFSVQWRCHTAEHVEIISQQSISLLNTIKTKFGEECLFFSSVLQEFNLD